MPLPESTLRRPSAREGGGGRLPTRAELAALLRLAVPVVVVQVGLMAMGVVDSIMVGHVSATALAAVAIGNLYFFGLAVFGMGVLLALDPVVSQAVGAGDEPAVARALQRGLVLAAAISVPTALLLLTARPFLTWAGQPAAVIPDAAAYAACSVPGVLPFFGFIVIRQTLQALHRMRPIVLVIVLANLANVGFNWVLIYGHLGMPPLGVVGSAWSTTISRCLMGLGIVTLAWPELESRLLPLRPELRAWAPLARMFRLGLPIGLQFLLESSVFGTVLLLMGRLGTVPVAAHQVAINIASLTFMVPLGVSSAATVLVGNAVGRGDARGARRAARASLVVGAGFMALTALVMLLLPVPLARAYSRDADVIALAATLLPIAGAFQVFDGLQVVSIGILRGLADTRAPFIIALLGFWLLGFPVSLWLGFRTPLGPAGLWWGLVVGLVAVATLLLLRVRARLRRDVRRFAIDDAGPAAGAPLTLAV
ncbi:MAG TPA: MATE family efflux transporter [Gemmatimonadales bacterium]|nr:MATE family efflux transporter [Gemmatimonadales bacterium]